MEVTIKRIAEEETTKRARGYHEDFTVFINDRRVLSVYTPDSSVANKWFSEVRKAFRNRKGPIIVGVSVEDDTRIHGGRVGDDPSQTMTICVGSHSLVFDLPECTWSDGDWVRWHEASRTLKDFFADPKMLFVGMDMTAVAMAMEKFQAVKVARSGDVRALLVKVIEAKSRRVREKRARRLTLDDAAKRLLDKRMEVERPKSIERDGYWEGRIGKGRRKHFMITEEYVMYHTLDAFFCHEIGVKYLEEFKKLSSSSFY